MSVGVSVNIASLHAMRGELDAAAETARGAQETATRLGLAPLAAAALAVEAAAAGLRGRSGQLETLLRRSEALAPDDPDLAAFRWGVGRGMCALVREERAAALAAFRRAIRAQAPAAVLDTARGPLLLTLAAEGTATGADLAAARATATPGAVWSDLWLGYGEAALAGARSDEHAAVTALASADPAARRHPLFRAIGLRLLAEAALRDQWGDPVSWLRDAEAVLVSGGQDRIAAACRGLLRQAGASVPRRRGADRDLPGHLLRRGVTAREAEVLELVAERLSNKDIAARLYLSPRTVEKHVASLLVKLDVADRAALIGQARQL
ncbi:MAG TPA: helix-turn-helix transcriptional regulator [Streptosporangiaceae bacterium]|nr:helix-turn-helix transcriptional regulator [Streptosporangiaceae bacterium]